MISLLPVAFVGAFALAGAATPTPTAAPSPSVPTARYLLLNGPERRVRAPDARVQALIARGFNYSPTFASLLIALNQSDVIVYVESVMTLPKDMMGRLSMVPLSGTTRYLRIQIRADLAVRDAVALIGHEMRHALEIADASDVRDSGDMIQLYQRIGHHSGGEHSFDTDEAQDIGRKVRSELPG